MNYYYMGYEYKVPMYYVWHVNITFHKSAPPMKQQGFVNFREGWIIGLRSPAFTRPSI